MTGEQGDARDERGEDKLEKILGGALPRAEVRFAASGFLMTVSALCNLIKLKSMSCAVEIVGSMIQMIMSESN